MTGSPSPELHVGSVFKRVLVGRAMTSHSLEHTLLPKVLALPVFASDALSSVSYATEEILGVLLVASASSYGLVMPIAVAIGALMLVVVTSYRQTVRAYPMGGGAYMVSRDNLGVLPGLVAAAALLTDYVLTVAVSIVAGVLAMTSAAPGLAPYRVELAIGFIALITLANLRGVRESGTLFAIPTYTFIASILTMIVVGLIRCVGGCPIAESLPVVRGDITTAVGAVGLFTILRAFSSGATALTGVEAIADGVAAFRRPQAKNAGETLAVLGILGVTMFIGISFLASRMHVTVSEHRTVVAQIADGVFGGGIGFYVVQIVTTAILVLAANTSYQDFPRLSSILARDRFMPRQFANRGDRLVFSNGVLVLATLASLLVFVFDADLTRLIQLYVVGVFTSFTLSQTGMVLRWRKLRDRGEAPAGWRRSMTINAIGALATGIVLCVVTATKFTHGAWIVIAAMPFIVMMFLSIRGHYDAVLLQLRRNRVHPGDIGNNHVILLVRELDAATAEALGYVRSLRPADLRIIFPTGPEGVPPDFRAQWQEFCGGGPALEPLTMRGGDLLSAVRAYVRGIERDARDFITVIVPEEVRGRLFTYLIRSRGLVRLKAGLLREPNVVVTDAPTVIEGDHPVGVDARPLIPQRTVALVFVSSVHDATVRAVNYAQSLGASETRAIYFDLDHEEAQRIEQLWFEHHLGIPLDIVEAPFRDLTGPMLEEVRGHTTREDTVVSVVMPEFIVRKWRHLLLHNQNALFVKRLMLFEPRVLLSSVPYVIESPKVAKATLDAAVER
jgi:amino acid transporter